MECLNNSGHGTWTMIAEGQKQTDGNGSVRVVDGDDQTGGNYEKVKRKSSRRNRQRNKCNEYYNAKENQFYCEHIIRHNDLFNNIYEGNVHNVIR